MSDREKTSGQTQILLNGLHIPPNLEKSQEPPLRPRQVVENWKVCVWKYIHTTQRNKHTHIDSHKIKWDCGKPSKQYPARCLQWNCFHLSDRINSLDSERPHKSFKAHISHGAKMMPCSPKSLLSGNNRTRTHTNTKWQWERHNMKCQTSSAGLLCQDTWRHWGPSGTH